MAKFNNPIAYGMRYAAQNIGALNRVGVCVADTTVYNGTLVTLSSMNKDASKDMGYVFTATPTTADTAVDVWMVRSPEVPMDVCGNLYDDPRAFSIEGGRPFDAIHLEPGDLVKLSKDAFTTVPVATSKEWIVPAANGKWNALASAAGKTGFVCKLVAPESFVVGQEYVDGYILEVVQNPNKALA